MLFLWDEDEKEIEINLLRHEIEELREIAEMQGYSKKQTDEFIKNSLASAVRSEYKSIGASDEEIQEHISRVLEKAGLKT